MTKMSMAKVTYDDGRDDQFREMMAQLSVLQAKYKGVRGELLAKVHDELAKLKPVATTIPARQVTPPSAMPAMLPTCRQCAHPMRLNGAEGHLICDRGHTRIL